MARKEVEERADLELDRADRERLARDLDESTARDHVLALTEAALSLVPGAGNLISYVISEHIPRRRQERMVEFARKLNGAVARIEGRLDGEFVRSNEFADLTEEVLENVARRVSEGKREFYAAAVANTATSTRPEQDERDRMLAALNELRPSHLRLLAIVAVTTTMLPESNISAGGIDNNILPRLQGVGREEMMADWAELARLGILDSYPSGMMSRGGMEDLTTRMTPFGRKFVAWVGMTDPDLQQT